MSCRIDQSFAGIAVLPRKNLEMNRTERINGAAICLLDDDPSVLRATARLLASTGRDVVPFDNPHSFLTYAQTYQPRLAILDIWMPLMHGLEVQRRLRDVAPSTKVIILTSKDDPSVRSQALSAGAAGFFTKPVVEDAFLCGIEAVLSNGGVTATPPNRQVRL
jgi:two-component system response regulator HydG